MRTYFLIAALLVTIACLGVADVVYVMAFRQTAKVTNSENVYLTHMMNNVTLGPDLQLGIEEVASAAGVDAKQLVARCRSSFNFTDSDLQVRMPRPFITKAIQAVREFRRPLQVNASVLSNNDLAALVFVMAVSDKVSHKSAE